MDLCRLVVCLCMVAALPLRPAQAQKLQVVVNPPSADAGSQPQAGPQAGVLGTRPADVGQVARLLVEKTNAFRRQQGLEPLSENRQLTKAAQGFAEFMAANDKYGHTADDREPAERAEAAGYDYCLIEENIAYQSSTAGFGTSELAERLFAGWKNSPEHRQQLLDPLTSEIGVAVAQSPKTTRYYGVQEFGRPKSAQIVMEIVNSSPSKLTYLIDDKEFVLEARYTRRHKRCTPPKLQIAGYDSGDSKPIVLHPASGDRYVVEQDGDGRVRVEKTKLDGEEPKSQSELSPAKGEPASQGAK